MPDLTHDDIEAVWRAGGEPATIHPADSDLASRPARFDGVLLPGGGDLAPHRYGAPDTHGSVYDVDDLQDAFDLALARWTIESGLPLLAVCRGLQVVDVALGGTLEQDMGGPGREHRDVVHPVEIQRGTLLEQATGARTVEASCYHHQRVGTVAPGLTVSARAADGTVEGLELPGAPGWFTAVQWHPEDTAHEDRAQQGLFDALVAAARDERRRPRLSSTLPARTRRTAG
ncbi:gamma-glutamyl-gamma-aminobutyrate hydrolase family protein [Streptomyces sp. NPDC005476]|uniref:gamma-glutamyl-gamma-aminobutyrate hydrolase family protein n=1 Tax=Streptomyces sp. NPDC005476 TaxID=3156882 RepID=UPI0034557623